jgi:hypothetical protein
MRDEGRPFGVGYQEQASNHPKPLRSKAVGGEHWSKVSRNHLELVRVRETTERKPPLMRRNPKTCGQNQRHFHLLGRACRVPEFWASGDRRIGGVNLTRALVRNCGNQSSDAKGEAQVAETTRREYRCGVLGQTNSFERRRPVIRSEQRGWVKRLHLTFNWQQEETV